MGTFTAQILIGASHPYHGGIGPSHIMFLSENSRPAWILNQIDIFEKKLSGQKIYIPTTKNLLEDAFTMIALFVVEHPGMIKYVESVDSDFFTYDRIETLRVFNDQNRKHLYTMCKRLRNFPKLVISILNDSSILEQIPVIEKYKMDVEVCCVRYSRCSGAFNPQQVIEGDLGK